LYYGRGVIGFPRALLSAVISTVGHPPGSPSLYFADAFVLLLVTAAYLLGHREVHLALADKRIVTFLKCYFAEVEQTVGAVEGVDLGEYQHTIIQRFSNTNIKCADLSTF
jgi:hypothetical protein